MPPADEAPPPRPRRERLNALKVDKRDVVIYDYPDDNHPVTQAMFRRRAAAYRQMGYRFEVDESLGRASLRQQLGLFDQSTASSPGR